MDEGKGRNPYFEGNHDGESDELRALRLTMAHENDALRARVLELEAQCEAGAASEQRWIDWLVATGLLRYHNACHRPDGSHGPAWVLRAPSVIDGDSCVAWHAESAAGALREFLKPPNDAHEPRP